MPGASGRLRIADCRLRNKIRNPKSKIRNGSVSLETTFFIIISALLFFGAVELGRGISVKHSMDVGCYRAARYLSFNPSDTVTAEQMIRDEVDNNILGGSYGDDLVVIIDMPSTSFQTEFTVSASVDYQASVPFLSLSLATLQAIHYNVVEAYP